MVPSNVLLYTALGFLCLAAAQLPEDPWSGDAWKQHVRSPDSSIVKPNAILAGSTTGDVLNPDGLITGDKVTVLTRNSAEDEVPSITIDFGLNVVGLLNIHFEGSTSSSDTPPGLQLAFSETKDALSEKKCDYTRSYRGVYEIAVKNEQYTWTDRLGCEQDRQVCSDGLHGFRYVKIWLGALESDAPHTSSTGSVSISSVDLEWSAYLGTADTFAGWFECSDQDITQWWFDGAYTVETNVDLFFKNETEPRDAFSPTLDGKWVLFDGAKRDRDPYVGDLAIASVTLYLSHDFPEASLNVLEDLALHQREDGWIPPASINNYTLPLFDYPLWWVVCSVDLVMYTGNTNYANTYWNVVKKTLDEYYPGHTNAEIGLLDKSRDINYGDYAFLPRSGPITYYNALYIHALDYAATLASKLGHEDDATRWSERATSVREALLARNFDANTNTFFDGGPCPDGEAGTICDVRAQDGNSIAVLVGVTDDRTSSLLLDYWAENTAHEYGNAFYDSSILSPADAFDQRVYALISFFELSARFKTPGKADSAYEEIRRLYGWMATHDPEVTQWEGIGPGGVSYQGPFMSYAHGWSTGIVPVLSNYVLGVTPTGPGFSFWTICPVVEGQLSWAKGVVPVPGGGPIKVFWEKAGDESIETLNLEIDAPENSSGVICIPDIGREVGLVTLNGEEQPLDGPIEVNGGRYSVVVQ